VARLCNLQWQDSRPSHPQLASFFDKGWCHLEIVLETMHKDALCDFVRHYASLDHTLPDSIRPIL